MAYKVRFNRNFNVNRVVKRLVRTVLALYVGGTIMTVFGTVMQCTNSPFYTGLSLIGWTIDATHVVNGSGTVSTGTAATCNSAAFYSTTTNNIIVATSGSGVLAVVGIIAIAQIVTEFVTW